MFWSQIKIFTSEYYSIITSDGHNIIFRTKCNFIVKNFRGAFLVKTKINVWRETNLPEKYRDTAGCGRVRLKEAAIK